MAEHLDISIKTVESK
ncbi:hypothetical protein [Flavobacterium sp. FlaQc-47]